jgi:hypothetical protein
VHSRHQEEKESASHSYEHRTPKDLPPGDGDGVMVSFIIGTVRHRLAGAEAAAWAASGKPLNDDPSSPRDDWPLPIRTSP